ncbi:hypothetical protein CNMCM5623_001264 [Aspergillus felis]|uniref:Carrier domain-containing protein n=1 Tax=Aspergillus felis TaxID=1287682 RepID=A0A8H6UV81_9EURO|nr:hypothetical protein CNMCM5623_001264 [Aspergillus felis]
MLPVLLPKIKSLTAALSFSYQPENEYTPWENATSVDPQYMQNIMDTAREAGVVIPFISNDQWPAGDFLPGSGVGAVDIYGHDAYLSTNYTLKVPTSAGTLAVPQLGRSLTLNGRNPKVHVTDYDVGGTNSLYSTAEILTWKKFHDYSVLIVYGGLGEHHEIAVSSKSAASILSGQQSPILTKSVNGQSIISWDVLSSRTIVQVGNLLILLLTDFTTKSVIENSIIVKAGYLVRTAHIQGDQLHLTVDFNATTDIEVIGPPNIAKCLFNGEKFSYDTDLNGFWTTQFKYTSPGCKSGASCVLTIVVEVMGLDEEWRGPPSQLKNPRGILDYSLSGHNQHDVSWKLTDNLVGEDYIDLARGPLNEGGLYAERQGWHQPKPPSEHGQISSPFIGLDGAGIGFYSTSFHPDLSKHHDTPLSFVFSDNSTTTKPYRVQLYVNGYQFAAGCQAMSCQVQLAQDTPLVNLLANDRNCIWQVEDCPKPEERVLNHQFGGYSTVLFLRTNSCVDSCDIAEYDLSTYDIALEIQRNSDGLYATLNYKKTSLGDLQARSMAAAVSQVAVQIAERSSATIGDLNLLSEHDIRVIREWNKDSPIELDRCVHQMISEQSAQNLGRLAVSAWDGELTYNELESLSSNLAHHLSDRGVGPEKFVAICLEKSKWAIVAILAVLKAGGAYTLLDPSHPIARMRDMCNRLRVTIVLSSASSLHRAADLAETVILVSKFAQHEPANRNEPDLAKACAHNALYAVFTSGSTGKPKGIIVEHGSFCSRAMTTGRLLSIDRHSRVLQFSSYAFDVVNRDVLFTLIFGGCICIPSEAERLSNLGGFMAKSQVNWASLTPSVAELLNPTKIPDLETLVLVGESMSPSCLTKWADRVLLVNGYGPAECVTVCCLRKGLTVTSDRMNIGTASGSVTWLVDPNDHNKLVPIGAVGEIVIEGPAVGRGYINDPEKTRESFLPDAPWLRTFKRTCHGKLYKTGDLAQYAEGGTLRFMGRKDNQVKIHGQRVELEEVECQVRNVLTEMPDSSIHDVAVELCSPVKAKDSRLVAYLALGQRTTERSQLLAPLERASTYLKELEVRMAELVPHYMIPTIVVPVWYIPLNNSCKKDRRKLRQLVFDMTEAEAALCMGVNSTPEGPRSTGELNLRTLWSQALNLEESSISTNDNFFQRGGDSIAAMKLAGLAHDVRIFLTFSDIFTHPTLSAQAHLARDKIAGQKSYTSTAFGLIDGEAKRQELVALSAKECGISPLLVEDIYPATPMQEGLIAMTAIQPGVYVAQRIWELQEHINLSALKKAWKATFDANPSLRTRIVQFSNGETLQVVVRGQFNCPIYRDLDNCLREGRSQPIQLGRPLAELAIVQGESGRPNACVLTVHHSIYDAWSISIILKQVEAAYQAQPLPSQPFSPFVDYIQQVSDSAKEHWKAEFSDFAAVQFPLLPSPGYIPAATGSEHLDVELPTYVGYNITLASRIRLAWAITVARYTQSNDVVFGVTVSGRSAPVSGIDKIVGATVATYPLRVQLRSISVLEQLRAIQENLLATVPFEQYGLQHISRLGDEAARACQFQSLLVIQPEPRELKSEIFRNLGDGDAQSSWGTYVLTLLCTQVSSQSVHVEAIYDARVLSNAQLQRILQLFAQTLTQVTQFPENLIDELDGISCEDVQQIQGWNNDVAAQMPVCLHDLFRHHYSLQPAAIAIAAWDGELTYKELEELSTKLAISLAGHGVRPETFVALCFEKSKWVAVAMLAVAKAGGAFILLDPTHPTERLQAICNDSHAKLSVCSVTQADVANALGCSHVIQIGDDQDNFPEPGNCPLVQAHPGNALYAVYTSGSTGRPKGVVVEHAAFATNAAVTGPVYLLDRQSRVFQFASHSFDATVLDYLFTLVCGGCVCVPEEAASRNDLGAEITKSRANWAALTPSVARTLDPRSVPTLDVLALVGEAAKSGDLDQWSEHVRLLNAYGPAECAVVSTIQTTVHKNSNPTNIGRGVAVASWLVDPSDPDKLAPIGSVGELLLEGPILARGYIGDPEQTASSFIALPKWRRDGKRTKGGKLYRTGDLARYSPACDGSIEYIGRKDGQVKLRGQRVELAEVEYQVAKCMPAATDVVVETITPSDPRAHAVLTAFVWHKPFESTSGSETETGSSLFLTPDTLFHEKVAKAQLALRKTLPRYMVPTLFVPLRYLPLSSSGKVNRHMIKDRASLFSRQQIEVYYRSANCKKLPPSSEVEKTVHSLIVDALGLDPSEVGMDDHFFHLGGDSISAMSISAKARRKHLHLKVVDILTNPLLSNMVAVAAREPSYDVTDYPRQFSLIPPREHETIVQTAMCQTGLDRGQIEDIYPCTPMQEGLLALTMQQSSAYICKLVFELSEHVDVARLRRAWDAVFRANPALRTRIVSAGAEGHLFQVVARTSIDWKWDSEDSARDGLSVKLGGPLFYLRIIQPEGGRHRHQLTLSLHHAIYDGSSVKLILRQFEAAYNGEQLPPRPYSSFVRHCTSLSTTRNESITNFWKEELKDANSPCFPAVPTDFYTLQAPKSVVHNVPMRFNSRIGTPLSALIKLAWGMVVSQFTGERDVVFGTVVSGRSANVRDIDQITGPTIATVPFRVRHEPTRTIQEALGEVQSRSTRMIPYEQTGLQRIRQMGLTDACQFQNLLLIQSPGEDELPISPLYKLVREGPGQLNIFDTYPLNIICTLCTNDVVIHAIFDGQLIPQASMERILSHFAHILTQLNETRWRRISDIPPLSKLDMEQLQVWNGTLPQAEDHCVDDLIQEAVAKRPHAPAVCAWDGQLTYTQLDYFSSLLSRELASFGLDPNATIPIYIEKSKWTPVAVLAAMKARRAFVLLDAAQPHGRLLEICRMVDAVVILSSKKLAPQASSLASVTLIVSDDDATWQQRELCKRIDPHASLATPEHPLYVVFTSGSTGKPKGVVISHRAFASMSMAHSRMIGFSQEMRALSFSSYSFDVSISDMLNTLIAGGCLCVPSSMDLLESLPQVVAQMSVNYADMTPSLLQSLRPRDFKSLKTIAVGGEPLTREVIAIWGSEVRLINIYGPAECCPSATVQTHVTNDSDPYNIGVGQGCLCWVVDPTDYQRLAPIGAVGELLIEGPIVGLGYVSNREQENARFIEAPGWLEEFHGVSQGSRLYRTGDLVQYALDGSLRFIGRKDNQIKLRGQRIELGEVEHHISQCFPQARDVVAEVVKPIGSRSHFLAAFVHTDDGTDVRTIDNVYSQDDCTATSNNSVFCVPSTHFRNQVAMVESQLQARVPAYMIPAVFIRLCHLPLTQTGKTDRRQLQEAAAALSQTQLEYYTGAATGCLPSTPAERRLHEIWAKVLNRPPDQISINSSFLRLGGDSISAMQLSSQCRAAGLACSVADILKYKTISALASSLELTSPGPAGNLDVGEEQVGVDFDLSPIQQAFFEEVPSSLQHHYNQSIFLRLTKYMAANRIDKAVSRLVRHHSMLRTQFHRADGGRWVQSIQSPDAIHHLCWHYRVTSHTEARAIVDQSMRALSIESGHVFRVSFIDVEGDGQYIFLVAHHLVVDLVSWRILLEDLEALLASGQLSCPPSLSFQIWCRLQANYSQKYLSPDHILTSSLPTPRTNYWDLPPERNTFGSSRNVSFTLSESITSMLVGPVHEVFHTSMADLLHAALLHSFARTFRDRPTPVIFSEGHGREPWDASIEISRTVGWFTTLWPAYVPVDTQMDVTEVVRQVKDARRQIQGNGWAYFASRYLHPQGQQQLSKYEPPEIVFNYLGQLQHLERSGAFFEAPHTSAIQDVPNISPQIPRPTIFDVSASVTSGALRMQFSYSEYLVQSANVERWISQCKRSLELAVEGLVPMQSSFTLCDLPLLPLATYTDLDNVLHLMSEQIGLSPADVETIYPCSPIQCGILLSQAKDPSRYITQDIGRVQARRSSGDKSHGVDVDRLKQAWQLLVDRHPILRTVFMESDGPNGHWYQIVMKAMPADIAVVECDSSDDLLNTLTNSWQAPSILWSGKRPLHQLVLYHVVDGEVFYDLRIHHALIDGVSARLLHVDLERAYDSQPAFDRHSMHYQDYIAYLQSHNQDTARAYWVRYLTDAQSCHFPSLNSPTEPQISRPRKRDSLHATLTLPSSYPDVSVKTGVTIATVFQLAWALVLRCYTGSDSVCFAYLNSGRDIPLQGIEQAVGPFINLLACRMDIAAHTSLPVLLERTQADYVSSLDHQHCSLADILHTMDLNGDSLFNTGISIQTITDQTSNDSKDGSISLISIGGDDAVDFDLTLNIGLCKDSATMTFNYSSCLLSKTQAQEVAGIFRHLVSEIMEHPDLTVGQLSPFGPGPHGQVWRRFSGMRQSDEYWRAHLGDTSNTSIFPGLPNVDNTPPNPSSYVHFSLESASSLGMTDISTCMCVAWAVVQSHYTRSDDIIFGITTEVPGTVEDNIVPCRLTGIQGQSISTVASGIQLHRVRTSCLSPKGWQSVLDRPVDNGCTASQNFQTQLCFSQSSYHGKEIPDALGHLSRAITIITSGYHSNSITLTAIFDSDIIQKAECQRLLQQLGHVFQQVVSGDPNRSLNRISVISPQDMAYLRMLNSVVHEPVNRCVQELILDQCEYSPAAIAVTAWDGILTYGDLQYLSTSLASYLLECYGDLRGAKIPICMEKSRFVPVAMLAVLQTGAACVMIDPTHPPQRIRETIASLAARLSLISPSATSIICGIGVQAVVVSRSLLDRFRFNRLPQPSSALRQSCDPRSPAFVVFTSGSTGKPKAIVMPHRGICTALRNLAPSHNITPGLRMLHFASFAFDASISETLFALSSGSCLCIPSEFDRTNNLSSYIQSQNVNWALLTPSVAALLNPADVPSLRTLLLAGEPLPSQQVDLWAAGRTLINAYGPAECTFACAVGRVPAQGWKPGSIGPMVNGCGWVTTESDTNQLAAVGAIGELLVEGPAIAECYLDDQERTAAAFIPSPPWLKDFRGGDIESRLYRTGDLVQYTTDGEIRFIGRRDTQVKLHGQRIELGEVEHHVQACFPDGTVVVAEVVLPAGDHARPLLAAFVHTHSGHTSLVVNRKAADAIGRRESQLLVPPNELFRSQVAAARASISSILPRHMVPSLFLPISYIPYSMTGKTDRRILRDLASAMCRTELEKFTAGTTCKSAPRTNQERQVQHLFAKVLHRSPETINAEDSFFELGGDSILAMALVSMARKSANRLSIADIFRCPRLSELALLMAEKSDLPQENGVQNKESSVQQKIASYFSRYDLPSPDHLRASLQNSQHSLSTLDGSRVLPTTGFQKLELKHYPHIYRILYFQGSLDHDRLKAACSALAQRHSILRTIFEAYRGTVLQVILPQVAVDFSRLTATDRLSQYIEEISFKDSQAIESQFHTHITKFTLVQETSTRHALIVRLSHAQYDAASMSLLEHDLKCLYEGSMVSEGSDFTAHMEHWLDAQTDRRSLDFWRQVLKASTMTYIKDPFLNFHGDSPAKICTQQHFPVSDMPKGVTPATLIKAAWAYVLAQTTQRNDVTFLQMVSTRTLKSPDTSKVIGPCLNYIPVRVQLQRSWSVGDLLEYVQRQHVDSVAHILLDFTNILEHCSPWPAGTHFGSVVIHQNIGTSPPNFSLGNADCYAVDTFAAHDPPPEAFTITTFPRGDNEILLQLEAPSNMVSQKYLESIMELLRNTIQIFARSADRELFELFLN